VTLEEHHQIQAMTNSFEWEGFKSIGEQTSAATDAAVRSLKMIRVTYLLRAIVDLSVASEHIVFARAFLNGTLRPAPLLTISNYHDSRTASFFSWCGEIERSSLGIYMLQAVGARYRSHDLTAAMAKRAPFLETVFPADPPIAQAYANRGKIVQACLSRKVI
jgi:hypothetical protein